MTGGQTASVYTPSTMRTLLLLLLIAVVPVLAGCTTEPTYPQSDGWFDDGEPG